MKFNPFIVSMLIILGFSAFQSEAMNRCRLGPEPVRFRSQYDPMLGRNIHTPIYSRPANMTDLEFAILRQDFIDATNLIEKGSFISDDLVELHYHIKELKKNGVGTEKNLQPYYELYELLLQNKVNPFKKLKPKCLNKSSYELAVEEKDQRILDLIKKYIQPRTLATLSLQSIVQAIKDGRMSLNDIKQQGYPEPIVAKIQSEVDNLFKEAVEKNNFPLLKQLFYQASANLKYDLINKKDFYSTKTLLIRAVEKGDVDLVKLLIAAGADPNIEDYKGKTALNYAANNQEIFDLLLEYKRARRVGQGK